MRYVDRHAGPGAKRSLDFFRCCMCSLSVNRIIVPFHRLWRIWGCRKTAPPFSLLVSTKQCILQFGLIIKREAHHAAGRPPFAPSASNEDYPIRTFCRHPGIPELVDQLFTMRASSVAKRWHASATAFAFHFFPTLLFLSLSLPFFPSSPLHASYKCRLPLQALRYTVQALVVLSCTHSLRSLPLPARATWLIRSPRKAVPSAEATLKHLYLDLMPCPSALEHFHHIRNRSSTPRMTVSSSLYHL